MPIRRYAMSTVTTTTIVVQTIVGEPTPQQHVTWAEDTVDNEGAGKKKSNKCCIFKKKRQFGESSSEEDSTDEDHVCRHSSK